MATTTHPPARGGPRRTGPRPVTRVQQDAIEGRYRPITTTQLVLSWWLYASGRISKRQLRVYFAAHEMAERRFYTAAGHEGCAEFTLDELKALVGGRGSATADRDLSADVKQLGALGLVKIARRSITFAETVEQLDVEDTTGFFTMWDHMDSRTRGRAVPVPRRMLRELAAGFTKGSTAYLIATLIRCVFWSAKARCYNTDGRIRDAWVAETFGIGLTAVRQGRRHLQKLGLLEKRDGLPQWNLNRYGNHIVVHCDWSRDDAGSVRPQSRSHAAPVENTDTSAVGEGRSAAKSDTPRAQNSGESDTPCLNRSALPTEDLETRRLGAEAPDPAGVSSKKRARGTGSKQSARPASDPNYRDMQAADFDDTGRLLELHRQAVKAGDWGRGEGSELEFLAMAERARARGREPARMLRWLVANNKFEFVTNADEDRARVRLSQHRRETFEREDNELAALIEPRRDPAARREPPPLSEEAQFVEKCVHAARLAKLREDQWWRAAHHLKQWNHSEWHAAYGRYQLEKAQQQSWGTGEHEEAYT